MIERLRTSSCWIFDLDGTLTLPVHDFGYIRRELAIPDGSDILGHLDSLPADEVAVHRRRLDEIELELAGYAVAAPGAAELLECLAGQGASLGILTRNSSDIALLTLRVIGVERYFPAQHILGREDVPPKPDPAGIFHLLASWGGNSASAVMVGDYLFDLQAGHAAGTMTVHVSRPDGQRWPEESDVAVDTLHDLLDLLD